MIFHNINPGLGSWAVYTTRPDGMGIGLTVCHSIIQSHGGRLTFQRYPEGGTIFEFTMPVAD